MRRQNLFVTPLVLLLSANSFAGIRGPGEYRGVVVFDRWDACYIYSSVYLMPVSEKTKKRLRKYQGQSMVINALEVDQPINPGDGLIGKYKVIGPAVSRRPDIRLDGLGLIVSRKVSNGNSPAFTLQVRNGSDKIIDVRRDELALTLFRKKDKDFMLEPSDDASYAFITRTSFRSATGTSNNVDEGGQWRIAEQNGLPDRLRLHPGQSKVISMFLTLPAGEYDFLCGYGGGVHYDRSIASNMIAFNVDEKGKAIAVDVARRVR